MSNPTRWLSGQIDRWTAEGIVTTEQAARIRALYPPPSEGAPWGMIAFSGLGAVVVGLGIILLLAYNWEAIPRLVKLVLILGATGAAHAGGLGLRAREGWRANLGEVLSLLGTMLFGAGIWLVAQVYHIDEHFPNGFLFWGLGALAMAWALVSVPQGIVAVVTLCIWGGSEVAGFRSGADVSWLLLAAGIGPLAWRCRSVVLTAVLLAALYVLLLMHAGHWGGVSTGYLAAFSLSALLVAGGLLAAEDAGAGALAATLRFFGTAGFVVCLYLVTFGDAADDLLRRVRAREEGYALALAYRWALFALALGAWGWVGRSVVAQRRRVTLDAWLCPGTLVLAHALAAAGGPAFSGLAALAFNLAAFCLASMWMVHGCRAGHLGKTVAGSLLLAALVLARFFDLFESLALRGLVFVILGAVLFAEGFYYRKLRRASDGREGAP